MQNKKNKTSNLFFHTGEANPLKLTAKERRFAVIEQITNQPLKQKNAVPQPITPATVTFYTDSGHRKEFNTPARSVGHALRLFAKVHPNYTPFTVRRGHDKSSQQNCNTSAT